jgi:hypothetical protein
MVNQHRLLKFNNSNYVMNEKNFDGDILKTGSERGFVPRLLNSVWAWLRTKRTLGIASESRGYYRRIHGKDVLDASYYSTSDGRWHGRLRLNNWTVKETSLDTQVEIDKWCLEAFMELHSIGYAEEEMTERVARRLASGHMNDRYDPHH